MEFVKKPKDYKFIYSEDNDALIACPSCNNDTVYFYKNKYRCLTGNGIFSKKEIEDYCGTKIRHF